MKNRKFGFDKRFRGYDRAEVDNCVYKLRKNNKLAMRKLMAIRTAYNNSQKELGHYHKLESTLQQSIIDAQETADDIKHKSRKEAKALLDKARSDSKNKVIEANDQANKIMSRSLNKSNSVSKGAMSLCKNIHHFRNQVVVLLHSQLNFIQSKHWNHIFDLNKTHQDTAKEVLHKNSKNTVNQPAKKPLNKLHTKVNHKKGFSEVMYPDGKVKELRKLQK